MKIAISQENKKTKTQLSDWNNLIEFCGICPSQYKSFEQELGYSFNKIESLYEALTHKSAILAFEKKLKKNKPWKSKLNCYERVEFLGDSVLGLMISSLLWTQKDPKTRRIYNEGELSRIKAFLVSEVTLAQLAQDLKLDQLILLSQAEKCHSGSMRTSLLADCLEALIGAIFQDGGYNQAKKFIKKIYQNILTTNLLEDSYDFKSQLQEIIQDKEKKSPHYETLETSGPDHEKKFKVGVYFAENKLASAWGASKKKASQEAAKKALVSLKQS